MRKRHKHNLETIEIVDFRDFSPGKDVLPPGRGSASDVGRQGRGGAGDRQRQGQRNMDASLVRGIQVEIGCTACNEKGKIPGGKYQSQGEVIPCPFCNGRRMTPRTITIAELRELLKETK